MHRGDCGCAACRAGGFEVLPFPRQQWGAASPFSADRETELAMELLALTSEQELDQFLGNVFKSVWQGVKKVGSTIGKVAAPLGGALKAVAKQALPFVGGALGSLIPIPGVGTALGTALGGAVSQALEMELGELAGEQQELEMARRFVRIAGDAARLAAAGDGGPAALRAALSEAVRNHVPAAEAPLAENGRWRRHGDNIVVLGDWE